MMDTLLKNEQENKNSQLSINKEKLSVLSVPDKMRYLDDLRIYYPKMESTLKKMEECQLSTLFSKRPRCLSIIGPSGSGKTTLMEIHTRKYPDRQTQQGIYKTILYSRIPCPARIGSLPSKMLYDIGDPFYTKRSNIVLQTQRLYDLIKACEVKLIILDEVQHLVDRNSEKLIRDSSDWFKELIDSTNVPVIFIGMPDSRKIFIENKQLANRVQLYEELSCFEYNDEFRKILYLFDINLPFVELSQLAQLDISKRIHIATNGLMKHVRDLIIESAIIAINNQQKKITLPILAASFNKILYYNNEQNPFLPRFEL